MARYKVILAYDGAQFAGFQRQGRVGQETRTVQGEFENALRELGWGERTILAAGRTDAGVHASGQVVAFDLDWEHSLNELQAALNAHLPADVAVQSLDPVRVDFHPRYDALARRYCYTLYCQPMRNPLRDRYAWRVWPEVNLAALGSAALPLIGVHDFAAFGTPPRGVGSTVRRVLSAGWQAEDGLLNFEIVADAFLFHMVRRLVFVQVRVAQGKLPSETIYDRLAGEDRSMFQGLAPAHGLALVEVTYA